MTHSKLHTLLTTHEILKCVRNGQGKKEWYPVEEIDTSIPVEDYKVGAKTTEQ